MKAINKIILPIFLIIIIVSCEKDKPNTVITEDPNEYKVFEVHVQKLSDKSPMKNCNLCFFKRTWSQSGMSYKDSIIQYFQTNTNGDVKFEIKSLLFQNLNNIFYAIAMGSSQDSSAIIDSLRNDELYSGGEYIYHNDSTKTNFKFTIEMQPTCEVKYQIYKSTALDKNIDSLFVSNNTVSVYEHNIPKYILTSEDTYYSSFSAECSKINTLKYYYYSNGVKSKEYTKDIYVPFSSQGLNLAICTLDFK